MLYLLDTTDISLDDLVDFIPYFPNQMQEKFSKIKNHIYLKNSLLAYLIVIFGIKKIVGYYFFPTIIKGKITEDIGIHVSISHTNNYVAVVMSLDEVGLDIEEKRQVSDKFIKKLNASNENDALEKWTKYEALYKLNNKTILSDFDTKKYSIRTIHLDENELIISIANKKG